MPCRTPRSRLPHKLSDGTYLILCGTLLQPCSELVVLACLPSQNNQSRSLATHYSGGPSLRHRGCGDDTKVLPKVSYGHHYVWL